MNCEGVVYWLRSVDEESIYADEFCDAYCSSNVSILRTRHCASFNFCFFHVCDWFFRKSLTKNLTDNCSTEAIYSTKLPP